MALNQSLKRKAIGLAALMLIALSVTVLERERTGLDMTRISIGTTPATLYQIPGQEGPVVVVAHGFAGSLQIMQAYSLSLAQSGYRVLAFDFEGHGRNPTPMSGDLTSIDGTTALLVEETRNVIAAARALPGASQIALLGHSMATDVIVRASIAEEQAGAPVDAVVSISMFSQAVTANTPTRLLVISGQWETFLRQAALDVVHQVDATASEGDLVQEGDVTRRAFVAPRVEHVGVLFSPAAVEAARDWLDTTFDRQPGRAASHMGLWILALLVGIVMALYPLVSLLPKGPEVQAFSARRFLLATLVPALIVPVALTPIYSNFLPVLVADYLMIHLALFGVLQLVLLGGWRVLRDRDQSGFGNVFRNMFQLMAIAVLILWGIVVFGLALDRYAASFWPIPERLPIIAALCIGTIPFMIADSYVTRAGRGPLWTRLLARALLFVSLGVAALLDPEQLTFVLIVMPVFLLFFLVHGLMGRWIARQSGAIPAGLGLGLCLAWALGVSFPMFAPL